MIDANPTKQSLIEISDFKFLLILTVNAAFFSLLVYSVPERMGTVVLFGIPSLYLFLIFNKLLKKLIRDEQRHAITFQISNRFTVSVRGVLAGILTSIVAYFFSMFWFLLTVHVVAAKEFPGDKSKDLFWKVIDQSVPFTTAVFVIGVVSAIYAGYVTAKTAQKSKVFNGFLALIFFDLFMCLMDLVNPVPDHWHGFLEILDYLLCYGSPVWGAAGAYLSARITAGDANIFETNHIGKKLRFVILLLAFEPLMFLFDRSIEGFSHTQIYFIPLPFIFINLILVVYLVALHFLDKSKAKVSWKTIVRYILLFVAILAGVLFMQKPHSTLQPPIAGRSNQ